MVVADTPNYDIFLDTRPGIPAAERYKMTRYFVGGQRLTPYFAGSGTKEVRLLVSGDGLRFTEVADNPVMTCDLRNAFDSHNVFFWSETEGQYVGYFRFYDGYRTMARITSPDLRTWSEPAPMTYGDTPREHLYTNATTAYFRAPHIYVALPARFMPGRRVVTDAQLAQMAVATSGHGQHIYYNDCSDGAFMTTRAGTSSYQRTFMESFVRPGVGPNNWVSRTNYPLLGVVQTGPAEMSFYVSRDYAQPAWHIRRYVLRLDGFTSLNAPYAGGEMRTKPLTFTGTQLEINYSTGAAGSVRVEIQDEAGAALPGFSLADSAEIIGDEIARVVTWGGSDDVSRLAGKAVRLRFVMHDADVFSLRFGA
ncbi:MAG: hypothetical protein EXR62_03910 [Chloroflexi bacterium]|nr:hypothetical protein [Chloroflexota bacterium]